MKKICDSCVKPYEGTEQDTLCVGCFKKMLDVARRPKVIRRCRDCGDRLDATRYFRCERHVSETMWAPEVYVRGAR